MCGVMVFVHVKVVVVRWGVLTGEGEKVEDHLVLQVKRHVQPIPASSHRQFWLGMHKGYLQAMQAELASIGSKASRIDRISHAYIIRSTHARLTI